VPDGGEDGRVEWNEGVDSTDFFPSRLCIFQSKAQKLTESIIRREVIKTTKGKRTKGKIVKILNAAMSEAIEKQGAYVVFCSKPFIGPKINKLRVSIEKAIREGKGKPSRLSKIDVYDANRIADWVNVHPPVALWFTSVIRRRAVVGLHSHEGWGRAEEISKIAWISDESTRYVPTTATSERDAWNFTQASKAILDKLSNDGAVVRIAGPSGLGKTRFAFQVFNQATGIADLVDRTQVLYADATIGGDELPILAQEIAERELPATLVVDDCNDDLHATLAGVARREGSRLRLLTIDIETRV
jgi:hypothetical protein